MKLCPNCKMVTESYGECIVCGHCVADEPHIEKRCEKYVLNKYFLPHLFKKHRFAVICLLISLAVAIISVKNIGFYALPAVVGSTLTLAASIFKNRVLTWMEIWYQEHYAEHKYRIALYMLGIFSILLAIATVLGAIWVWASVQEPI